MQINNITFHSLFHGYEIQAYPEKELGCFIDILARIEAVFYHHLFHHKMSKTLFMRFDLTFPLTMQYPPDNMLVESFSSDLMKYLLRKGLSPHYLWVRERKPGSHHHHYHFVLLLNGQKTYKIWKHLQKAEQIWHTKLCIQEPASGLIDFCNSKGNNGLHIYRNDRSALHAGLYWSSYLAKISTKEFIPGVRNYGSSQLYHRLQ
jgi:protein GP2